jgi:hypothetical protein
MMLLDRKSGAAWKDVPMDVVLLIVKMVRCGKEALV